MFIKFGNGSGAVTRYLTRIFQNGGQFIRIETIKKWMRERSEKVAGSFLVNQMVSVYMKKLRVGATFSSLGIYMC